MNNPTKPNMERSVALALPAQAEKIKLQDVIKEYRHKLRDFIRLRVNNKEQAEDLVQDVMVELVHAFNIGTQIEKIPAWLYRVTRNKITDFYRKKKTELLDDHFSSSNDEDDSIHTNDILADNHVSINNADQKLMMNTIEDAIAALPAEQREVFVMHEIEEKSFQEISEITGVGINTLLSRKRYAVLSLRKKLQWVYDDLFLN